MKANILKTNFTGGEIDPVLKGRMDVPRYQNGCEMIENAFVLATGGCRRSPGSKYIANAGAGITVKRIPFRILRKDLSPPVIQGYIVEFRSDNKIRFYTNQALILSGGNPYEINSPFTSNLNKIKYEQFDNVLYLVHPNFPPQRLQRASDTSWTIESIAFQMPDPQAVFKITRSGSTATVIQKGKNVSSITRSGDIATVTTSESHGFFSGDKIALVGANEAEYNGTFQITKISDVAFTYTVPGAPATPATGTITAAKGHAFATGQVVTVSGANEAEYNGTFQIVSTTSTSFDYTVTGSPATPATGSIKVQLIHWNSSFGYPACITFFEQRIILGNTKAQPQSIWGSKSGEIVNIKTGETNDSDPFTYTLMSATAPILHLMATGRQIMVLTADKEILVQGSSDKALTPTNIQVRPQTHYGSYEFVRPLSIGSELLFVTRFGRKIRALGYKFESDSYTAPEQSHIAGHLFVSAVQDMALSVEPYPIVWALTDKLLMVAFERDQEVVAFSKTATDGTIKGVTVIPGGSGDEVWIDVERIINGTTYTYVEVFDYALNTHCAYTGTDAVGKATWTGLTYLEGKTVDIVADGVVMPQKVVSGGSVTLPRNAKAVEIGLHYESEIKELPFALISQAGSTYGSAISIHEIWAVLHESVGCEINGEVIPFRKFGAGMLDEPVSPFSGAKKVSNLGWDEGIVTIKQTQPLPFTALAIVKKITINE